MCSEFAVWTVIYGNIAFLKHSGRGMNSVREERRGLDGEKFSLKSGIERTQIKSTGMICDESAESNSDFLRLIYVIFVV